VDNDSPVVLTKKQARGTTRRPYGDFSLWLDSMRAELTPREPLAGDTEADIAIVGAGYTGLWSAYYLLKTDPTLRIAIIEAEIAGFGASGRNGGWCSALFAAPKEKIAKLYGRHAAIAQQRAMFDTVDEVGRVLEEEDIDAHFHKGGTLTLVTSPTQVDRVRAMLEKDREWGFGEEDYRWLDSTELDARVRVEGTFGARYTPHCARVHPARLVRGLADTVEEMGARIYELTPAGEIHPGSVKTERGTVRAGIVVRATEGYTARIDRMRRKLLPLYSLMIATEPLPAGVWEALGWDDYDTLHDGRHLLIYAQRTADDRIAIGGRGAPYHFGSRIVDDNDREPEVFAALRQVVSQLFPVAAGSAITHEWGGCLGVPRDWFSSVGFDRRAGIAWAGGYVGDGVSTANLAGRTLRDLILGLDSDLTHLPWVNHHSPTWEPEPLRWLGVNLGLKAMAYADKVEARTGKPNRKAEFIKKMIGI
jgi:glycine/D-amino acid oxidase-like deaminating enzyme